MSDVGQFWIWIVYIICYIENQNTYTFTYRYKQIQNITFVEFWKNINCSTTFELYLFTNLLFFNRQMISLLNMALKTEKIIAKIYFFIKNSYFISFKLFLMAYALVDFHACFRLQLG